MHLHPLDPGALSFVASARTDAADARDLQRSAGAGVVRVRRGVYSDTDDWTRADGSARHRMRIDAVLATRKREPVVAFQSAAVLWGIPIREPGRQAVHTIVPADSSARSKNGVTVHRLELLPFEVVELDGRLVTSPMRTALDLARELPFIDAIIALDFMRHPTRPELFSTLSKEVLRDALDSTSPRGSARAARAPEFAESGADSPAESSSRVVIHQLGFPRPALQVRHPNPRGGYYSTDLEWKDYRVIGEVDGRGKYVKEEFLRGRTPGDVVYEEKIREDHLRAEGRTVVRWGWPEIQDPPRLASILSAAGLPRARRGIWIERPRA